MPFQMSSELDALSIVIEEAMLMEDAREAIEDFRQGKPRNETRKEEDEESERTRAQLVDTPKSPSVSDDNMGKENAWAKRLSGVSPKSKGRSKQRPALATTCHTPHHSDLPPEVREKLKRVGEWVLVGEQEMKKAKLEKKKGLREEISWPKEGEWKRYKLDGTPHVIQYCLRDAPIRWSERVADAYCTLRISEVSYQRIKHKPTWQWKTFTSLGKVIVSLVRGALDFVKLNPQEWTGPPKDPRKEMQGKPPHVTREVAPPWPEPKPDPGTESADTPASPPVTVRSVIRVPEATRRKHENHRASAHRKRR